MWSNVKLLLVDKFEVYSVKIIFFFQWRGQLKKHCIHPPFKRFFLLEAFPASTNATINKTILQWSVYWRRNLNTARLNWDTDTVDVTLVYWDVKRPPSSSWPATLPASPPSSSWPGRGTQSSSSRTSNNASLFRSWAVPEPFSRTERIRPLHGSDRGQTCCASSVDPSCCWVLPWVC